MSVLCIGACITFEVDKQHILFTLSIVSCLSQLKQTINKYGKVAIPENGHYPKVWYSVRRALRCMTGIFSTTVAAGNATRFRFNVIPPNDSNSKELYQLVTLFSAFLFTFIFCCVISLLFHKIEIFYLET